MGMILEPSLTDQPFDFFSRLIAGGDGYASLRDLSDYDEPQGDELSVPIVYVPRPR